MMDAAINRVLDRYLTKSQIAELLYHSTQATRKIQPTWEKQSHNDSALFMGKAAWILSLHGEDLAK